VSDRYPKQDAMFTPKLEAQFERFAELREDFCINYGYNTARAYWADLDDILWWAAEHGKDPLALTDDDIGQYLARMKRQGYSPSTVRRRLTAWRGFTKTYGHVAPVSKP